MITNLSVDLRLKLLPAQFAALRPAPNLLGHLRPVAVHGDGAGGGAQL